MEWSHLSCQKKPLSSQKKVRESRPLLGSAPTATVGGRPGPSVRARFCSCTRGSGDSGEEGGDCVLRDADMAG